MNILTINTKYYGGGAAKIASDIHNEINKDINFNSLFISGFGKQENSSIVLHSKYNKYFRALFYRCTGKELNIKFDIEKYIKDCDVVHLHNLHGYYINYFYVFECIIKYDKPLVWTLHDIWAITGRCAIDVGCDLWKSGCGNCPNKNIYPKTYFDKSNQAFIDKRDILDRLNKDKTIIVAPSLWLASLLKDSILKDFKIKHVPNSIISSGKTYEDKHILRQKYSIDKEKPVVLFIAANPNDKLKGIDLLLRSIQDMKDVLFITVGKEIDLKLPNLLQLGYITSSDTMNEIYRLSDIYVNPSLSENFPTTILEAFYNKTPVIGFRVGGIVEQLSNDCGYLVENIDEIELRNGIKYLLNNSEARDMIVRNAYERLQKDYNYNEFIKRYKKLYQYFDNENYDSFY